MQWPGGERARVRGALALASLLHAAALATLGTVAVSTLPADIASPAPNTHELELELDVEPVAVTALQPAEPEVAAPVARVRRAQPVSAEPVELAGEPELVEEASPANENQDQPPDALPPDRVVDLGLGPEAWRTWTSVAKADPKSSAGKRRSSRRPFRAPPASSTGGLQEGLEARDRELGLGPSGPVIGALYRAAHSDLAPQLGTALFQVTVLDSGHVEVSVRQASDRSEEWAQVAARAAEALRNSPPRIPRPRSGVTVVVEVTAEALLPNGVKRKELTGPHLEAQAPRLEAVEDAQTALKRLNPTAGENGAPVTGSPIIVDLPGVYLAQTGKVCSYRLGLTPLGPVLSGGCDPSNIGAKAQRMVRTQVREETLF